MTTTKRTATKEGLAKLLNANFKKVQAVDKNLAERITYTGKHFEKATLADLTRLATEVSVLLGDEYVTEAPKEVSAENSVKPSKKKPVKKTEKKKEVEEETSGDEVPAEDKASQSKSLFPDTINVGDAVYSVAKDIDSLSAFCDAVSKEEDVVVVFYYPRAEIKQLGYFNNILGTPKSFPDDLDVTQAIFTNTEKTVAYTVSVYTDAVFTLIPEDFELVDGVKIAGRLKFEVYRK